MADPALLSILVVNPNSSASITAAIKTALASQVPLKTSVAFFNPVTGPPGISDEATAAASCVACMAELPGMVEQYDGVLVACFSEHPLIAALREYIHSKGLNTLVLGIFHAGVASALLRTPGKFGIIATGTGIKTNHYNAVDHFVGAADSRRFAGSFTTGLGVVELQEGDRGRVEDAMKETTKRLVRAGAEVIVLGCGGMCGMEAWIHESAKQEGTPVHVVDGAKMGLQLLLALRRGQ